MKWKRFIVFLVGSIAMMAMALIFYLPKATNSPPTEVQNWNTETNLPLIGTRTYYDLIFLGTSHARIFSRFQNHERVEKTLGKSLINLAQGYERGGARSQQMYFLYFYEQQNFANTLVYFVDPFIFYRKRMDANPEIYTNEPFNHDFYNVLKENDTPKEILNFYLTKEQKGLRPTIYPEFDKTYQGAQANDLQQEQFEERIRFLYEDSYDKSQFDQTFANLTQTFRVAREHGMRVVVIIPTTLLPEQKGDKLVYAALEKGSKDGLYEYYNFAHAIKDTSLYYDTDHLNTEGVLLFTNQYLKPILEK